MKTYEQKRKFAEEMMCLASIAFGVLIFVLNCTGKIPLQFVGLAYLIAYGGKLGGPIFVLLGIGGFREVRNTPLKDFRKKAR